MKKILKLLVLTMVMSPLFTTGVSAKEDNGKKSFVALGDSIPYGYNLSESNESAARVAFPYLIGKEGEVRVRNLGVPGWTTDQLLRAVKFDQKYRQAVRHADYVSLTIGSNDLLRMLETAVVKSGGSENLLPYYFQIEFSNSNLFGKINNIIAEIRSLTDAPIVIYNIYNPFVKTATEEDLHDEGDFLLTWINPGFSALAEQENIYLADANEAFGDNQGEYVIAGDIHPTLKGQRVLAEIGLDALDLAE